MLQIHRFSIVLLLIVMFAGLGYGQNIIEHEPNYKEIKSDIVQYSSKNAIVENKSFPKSNVLVDIGGFTGSSWGAGPINGQGNCGYYQALYFQGEINVTGKRIKSISYYMEGDLNWTEKIEVYMGHTDSTRIYNWVGINELERVYSGEITTEAPAGWLTIELTHPFEYNNEQNLVIGVIDNQQGKNVPFSTFFWQTLTDESNLYAGPKLYVGAALTGPITAEYTDWILSGAMSLRPDIRLEFEDIPDKALLRYKPEVADYIYYHDFGSKVTDSETSETFYFENVGKKAITITNVTFDNSDYWCDDVDITIAPGENYTFTVYHKSNTVGDTYSKMHLNANEDFEGDTDVVLRTTVYKRGYLYEGWEIKPEDFPPLGWDYSGIVTPEDWFIYTNWYVNRRIYPESFTYDRLGLVQSIGYDDFGRDTLITPKLDIKDGDSLTFYAYDDSFGGQYLPIYYTADKKTYTLLENVVFEGWDLGSANQSSEKWTKHVVDLSAIPGEYHLCFVEERITLPHIDLVEGPALALKNNDALINDISAASGLILGAENEIKIELVNYGRENLTNYEVKLMQAGNPAIELAKASGSEMLSMDKNEVVINWVPDALGEFDIYAEVVAQTDEDTTNNTSEVLSVSVYSGTSVQLGVKDDKDELSIYPLNFNWVANLSQGIYFADELQMGPSELHEINLYMTMIQDIFNEEIHVWVGETDRTDLTKGMIPANELTLVYSNENASFKKGEYTFRIPFSEPYSYTGKNLVFMIQKKMTDTYHDGDNMFHVSNNPKYKNRSITYYHRSVETDPYNPPPADDYGSFSDHSYINFPLDFYADATFYFDTKGLGKINGMVTVGGNALDNVNLNVDGSYFKTTSDENGYYEFNYLKPGEQFITASKFGYYDTTQSVNVIGDFHQVLDFKMEQKSKYTLSGVVIDHNDNLLTDAEVIITGYENFQVMTDASGTFNANIWENNIYEITIKSHGFKDTVFEIEMFEQNKVLDSVVMVEIPAFADMVTVATGADSAIIKWGKPSPAKEKEFRYDSGIIGGMLGFSSGDKSQLGSTFKNKALITEVSFFVRNYMRDDYARVYIYGLNNQGKPDPSNVLHISDPVKVTKEQWTTYTLDVAVYAPNGFYVGINSKGYLALGTAESTAEYPFMFETHYHTWSLDHASSVYYFIPSEYDGNIRNLMLRVNGYNYNDLEFEFYNKGRVKPNIEHEHKLVIKETDKAEVGEPEYTYKHKSTKAFESYTVYRLRNDQVNNPENWTIIASELTDTSWVDKDWSTLEKGVYHYAVEAKYDSGLPSYIRKSEQVGKHMESDVTINISLPEKTNLENVNLTLKQLKLDGVVYERANLTSNTVSINKVWNGKYLLNVWHNNCNQIVQEVDIQELSQTIDVELNKALNAPVNLSAEMKGSGNVELNWESYPLQTTVLDDSTAETGYFGLPSTYVEFGNRFVNKEKLVLTNVQVYGAEHPWAMRGNKVYIKVYNNSNKLIGTSEPFELPYNGWTNVSLPNIKVNWNYYIMLVWDYIYMPTNLIGIDANGETALNRPSAYVNDNWNFFQEFGSVGGTTGAFLIRPQHYFDTTGTKAEIIVGSDEQLNPVVLPYASRNGFDGTAIAPTNTINEQYYNVYLNNFDSPYATAIPQNSFLFRGISYNTHNFGVSVVNNFGESELVTTSFETYSPSNDASLANLFIDSVAYDNFDPEVFNYIISYTGDSYPLVSALATDTNAMVEISDNQSKYVNIQVTAADFETVNNYAVMFSKNTSVSALSEQQFKLYPNPARESLSYKNAGSGNVRIYTIDGRLVHETKTHSKEGALDISHLKQGNYIVQFANTNGIQTQKLTIE